MLITDRALTYFFIVGCAAFFHRHGEQERTGTGIRWAALSLGLSLGAHGLLGWPLGGCILVQLLLFVFATGLKMRFQMPTRR